MSNINIREDFKVKDFYEKVIEKVCDKIKTGVISQYGWSNEVIEHKLETLKNLWQEELNERNIYPNTNESTIEYQEKRRKIVDQLKLPEVVYTPTRTTMLNPYEYPLIYDKLRHICPDRQIHNEIKKMIDSTTNDVNNIMMSSNETNIPATIIESEPLTAQELNKIKQQQEDEKYEQMQISNSNELGSEDDTLEDDIPEINNDSLSQYTSVKKKNGHWIIKLKHGIMHINGKDYVFKNMKCNLDFY